MKMTIDRIRGHSFIGSLIPANGQVVDLGMNRGDFSYEIQRKYHCRVLGVEANPMLVARMAASETLRPLHYAITAAGGQVSFYIDPALSEASSLTPRAGDSLVVSVPGITLPELLALGEVTTIDLLKIDVEGAELQLLQSTPAAALLAARQITVEFHAFTGLYSAAEIARILARMERLGFLALDFSRTYEDVLLVNRTRVPITAGNRAQLLYEKYRRGTGRILSRWRAGAVAGAEKFV